MAIVLKKTGIHLFFFLFLFQASHSQDFIKIGDSIMTEEKFLEGFELVKDEYKPKHTFYSVFETVKRNDSVINNILITVTDHVEKPTYSYHTFLNKPFPFFKLRDIKNVEYSNNFFYDKPTLVCIWNFDYLPNRKKIKKLNSVVSEDKFNVIAFLTDGVQKSSKTGKMDFPVIKNASQWLNVNFEHYYTPQYLIINTDGIVTYLFPIYPDKETKNKPIDSTHREIFEKLVLDAVPDRSIRFSDRQ